MPISVNEHVTSSNNNNNNGVQHLIEGGNSSIVSGKCETFSVVGWLKRTYKENITRRIKFCSFVMCRTKDADVLNKVFSLFIESFSELGVPSQQQEGELTEEGSIKEKGYCQQHVLIDVGTTLCRAYYKLLVKREFTSSLKCFEDVLSKVERFQKEEANKQTFSRGLLVWDNIFALSLHGKGRVFEACGQNDEAIQMYSQVTERFPNFAWSHCERGYLYYSSGISYTKALASYNKAMQLISQDYQVYFCRAMVYEKMGMASAALQDYARSIELNHFISEAYYNSASLLLEMQKPKEALQCYDKVISVHNSNCPFAFFNRAVFLQERLERPIDAFHDFCKAIELNPQFSEAYQCRAKIYSTVFDDKHSAAMDIHQVSRLSQ